MRYEILRDEVILQLEEQVEKRLNAGWKCQGGVYVLITPPGALTSPRREYYQAMVHEG